MQLLALDLDDTLLNEDLEISQEDQRSLRLAEELGVHIVLASGRTPEAMAKYLRVLEMDRREGFLISYNGAQILRSDTGEVEWNCTLEPDTSRALFEECRRRDVPIQCYRRGTILVTRDNPYSQEDTRLTGMPRRVVDEGEFFAEEPVKLVIPMDPEPLALLAGELQEKYGRAANMFISKPFYFEILSPRADKGLALEQLALRHGFARDQVMAMGDALNDAGMLRWAGLPVAPANARPEIKKLVQWVTSRDHNHSAVTEAVSRFILQK